jgi:hypothetical protein
MTEPVRQGVTAEFSPLLDRLQWRGEGYRNSVAFKTQGIVYVPDPYIPRR